jgi:NAD(P)-dependent dehydrogenase (short-subunit alcohol dehydrogenase family)
LPAEGAAHVVVADLEQDAAQAVASGHRWQRPTTVNVRDEAQIAAMVDDVLDEHGRIDLFCSNAGIIATDGPPWYATSASNETWQAMWDIHVMSHVYAARACLPR